MAGMMPTFTPDPISRVSLISPPKLKRRVRPVPDRSSVRRGPDKPLELQRMQVRERAAVLVGNSRVSVVGEMHGWDDADIHPSSKMSRQLDLTAEAQEACSARSGSVLCSARACQAS